MRFKLELAPASSRVGPALHYRWDRPTSPISRIIIICQMISSLIGLAVFFASCVFRKEIDDLVKPARDAAAFSPEDRVTRFFLKTFLLRLKGETIQDFFKLRAMEIQEDLLEKSQLLKEQEKEKEEILPKVRKLFIF